MVATLQSRKEALEAKLLEKNEELKKLCLQEAELTGVMPPEIPLEPGEPPPPIRRRVGTSFSFPQSLINNVKDADEDTLTALELECKVQTNIAEAALALANDTSANKAARRKHRLMYRQSQRRLMELETRLNLLRQGKSHHLKPLQMKKKPRPNTTAVENLGFFWNKSNELNSNNFSGGHMGSWPAKRKPEYSFDDIDGSKEQFHQSDIFGNPHKSFTIGTSQSSGSPRTDFENEEFKLLSTNFCSNHFVESSSHSNITDVDINKPNLFCNTQHHKRNSKRGVVRRQWDTQSAGGTLLPSQTYPDHSHQPNLSRTQSLGSVESNSPRSKDSWSVQDFMHENNTPKEKEWYETSLDSAPSPPLRTTSRLPSTARILYQAQDVQTRDMKNLSGANTSNLQTSNSHPALPTTPNLIHKTVIRSVSAYPSTENSGLSVDNIVNSMELINLNPSSNLFFNESGKLNSEFYFDYSKTENRKQPPEFSSIIQKKPVEEAHYQTEEISASENQFPGTSSDLRFLSSTDNVSGLPLLRQNSLTLSKYKNFDASILNDKKHDTYKIESVYINIPESNSDFSVSNWAFDGEFNNQKKGGQTAVPQEYVSKSQTTTQPYFHVTKHSPGEKIKNLQYQAARNRHSSIAEEKVNYESQLPIHTITQHPPHAIVQNEISFDTVVPFESPQNHTVIQAGKWQPYREVTKPFEMSDFYKYSTKFRQNKCQGNRSATPDVSRNSPNTTHQKGIYMPLRPMTCQPVESRSNQSFLENQISDDYDLEKTLVEVSPPEIV